MDQGPVRITLELNASDYALVARAAQSTNRSPADYLLYAAMRMARQETEYSLGEATTAQIPSRRSLHRGTVPATTPTAEIVRQLVKALDAQLLAITVGASAAEVQRWADGASEPTPTHERRLREAHEAWQLVVSVESPETTRAWWMGLKDELDDLSPAEAIALDEGRAVMSVARAFVESG